ncbi:hypothetical protein EVAR_12819_1 [Eumeta japonica]|uniref:Uncharacterized protein n=1 Tax=Eumeta variegata TaxID=151549 RepID=A0A4C1UB25_EUMVA|nr:hypothetical protein EVAR_12819_1 [Eumeta japonica]
MKEKGFHMAPRTGSGGVGRVPNRWIDGLLKALRFTAGIRACEPYVIAAFGQPFPQRSHQCVADFLRRNRLSYGSGKRLIEGGVEVNETLTTSFSVVATEESTTSHNSYRMRSEILLRIKWVRNRLRCLRRFKPLTGSYETSEAFVGSERGAHEYAGPAPAAAARRRRNLSGVSWRKLVLV